MTTHITGRALVLAAATLTLFLIGAPSPAQAIDEKEVSGTLPEMHRPTFKKGYQIESIRNGARMTVTLIDRTPSSRTWQRSDGCTWSVETTGFAPAYEWRDCGSAAGRQSVRLDNGSPYPIKLGSSWAYSFTGENDVGRTWRDERTCAVEGTARISTGIGTFDTYKVVCREFSSTRTWYMSPKIGRSVYYIKNHERRGRDVWEFSSVIAEGS